MMFKNNIKSIEYINGINIFYMALNIFYHRKKMLCINFWQKKQMSRNQCFFSTESNVYVYDRGSNY